MPKPAPPLASPRVLRACLVAALGLAALGAAGCSSASGANATFGDAGDAPALSIQGGASAPPASQAPAGASADPRVVPEPLPPTKSSDLATRGRHLLEAIIHDDPSLAADLVFPRDAFIETKDHPDPGKLWDKKFYPSFTRDLHKLRKRTKLAERARFVSFEIGHSTVQVLPKKKENKRTVWRVRGSKLTYAQDGKTHRIEVSELTSWRGAWYVTRLR